MKKVTIIMMIITLLSKGLGFIRDMVLSYFYGATNISDAYLISKTIPSFMFMLVGTAIVTGFIPLYTKIEKEKNIDEADQFTSSLLKLMLVISTLVVFVVIFYAPSIVKLFASGFDSKTLNLAVKFTRINIFTMYFMSLIYVFKGYLNINGNFIATEMIGLPFNIIVIISIAMSYVFEELLYLPIGFSVAVFIQMIFLLKHLKKYGFKFSPSSKLNNNYIGEFIKIAIPTLIGVSVNEINVLVDRTLASRLEVGGISIMNYASQLNIFVQGIFVMTIATVIYPLISKMFSSSNTLGMKRVLASAVISVSILVLPSSIGFIIFSNPIISLFYGRGAFDINAVNLTGTVLIFYSIGMIGIALREILSRFFYSFQDTRTPMNNAAIGMAINVILNILLSRYFGLKGLALATSIAATFTTVLLIISLRKKIGPFGMKQISISFLKILFASSIMGLLAKLSFNYLTASLSQNLSLLLAIGVGAVSYFVIIYFMKIEDVDVIVGAIKKKLGRKR